MKVDRATGEPLSDPIDPADLLVHAHRDRHPAEIAAQFLASRFIQVTGNESLVKRGLKLVEATGSRVGRAVGDLTGNPEDARTVKRLLGVTARDYAYQFREPAHLSEKEMKARVRDLQKQARARLAALGKRPRLRVLLTGATGFLGKEILAQAASHPHVVEVVSVVRPETIRDRKTKKVLKVLSARERGALLLKRIHVSGKAARKFRFVEGDVERPGFGIDARRARAAPTGASPTSFTARRASPSTTPTRTRSARTSSAAGTRSSSRRRSRRAPGSPFVAHVAIETSYIHGRRKRSIAQEDALVFPRHFYNNYYELTKAMASIETDRALVEEGLRVTQLLPSIVIGHSRTGNNRGDTKVLNAPVNAFGRAKEALDVAGRRPRPTGRGRGSWEGSPPRSPPTARRRSTSCPSTAWWRASWPRSRRPRRSARGCTSRPTTGSGPRRSAGSREEELEVGVRMADPTLTRNLTLPLVKALLLALGEPKLANVLEKLGTIFGVYGEWGQPIHDVGNDVRLLGLPIRRPDTLAAFRMLCRHNKYVQEFGQVRDLDEVARRERLWEIAIDEIEYETGPPGRVDAARGSSGG